MTSLPAFRPATRQSFLFVCLLLCLLLAPYLLSAHAAPSSIKRKKLSDTELQELEDQWFEDETEDPEDITRWRKQPDGSRAPPKPKTKSEMAFVALRRPITKDETADWGGKQADLLTSGGVDVRAYPVEAGKVLFVADKGYVDMMKVQQFILKQPRVVDFEWNQKKSYPKPESQKNSEEAEEEDKKMTEDQERLAKIQQMAAAGTLDLNSLNIEGQNTEGSKKSKKKKKAKVPEASLGGASSSIPMEIPDDDEL